jgi:hypothetical protein
MLKLIFLICLILTANINLFSQTQSDVEIGQYIYISKPFISRRAGRTQPNSQTKVKITVNEKGFVNSAIALEGHPLLRAMSVQAARQTKFIPTTINGKPVRVTGVITFDFQYFDAKSFAIELCPIGRVCNEAQNREHGNFNVVYGGILNGRAKSLEKPQIPDEIKAQLCKDEIVYVRVSVWGIRGGSPISAEVASGHPLLRQLAIDAALKSTFWHSNINGQDILVSGLIVYRFPVDKDKPKIEIGKPTNLVSPTIPGAQ